MELQKKADLIVQEYRTYLEKLSTDISTESLLVASEEYLTHYRELLYILTKSLSPYDVYDHEKKGYPLALKVFKEVGGDSHTSLGDLREIITESLKQYQKTEKKP